MRNVGGREPSKMNEFFLSQACWVMERIIVTLRENPSHFLLNGVFSLDMFPFIASFLAIRKYIQSIM